MATVSSISPLTLPVSGSDMDAEPITQQFTNILNFLNEASNIDQSNCDLTSADGLVGKSTAQTIAGSKTFSGTTTFSGATAHTGTVTVGVNDTGHDVKIYGATSGAFLEWDESADELEIRGGAGAPGKLLLSTAETTVVDGNKLGQIDFQAPLSQAALTASWWLRRYGPRLMTPSPPTTTTRISYLRWENRRRRRSVCACRGMAPTRG